MSEYTDNETGDIESADFGYEYPDGLNWRPDSDLSRDVCDRLTRYIQQSRELLSGVKDEWQKLDHMLSAFVPPEYQEARTRPSPTNKPQPIVVPVSFAALETLLAYMSAIFLKDPIHGMRGCGTIEDVIGVALLERIVGRHSQWFSEPLRLMTQWRDAFVYGVGIVHPVWRKKHGRKVVSEQVSELLASFLKDSDVSAQAGDLLRYASEEVLFEGNALENIDPYRVLLDPNARVDDIQRAEFVGWMERTNAMELLRREPDPEEAMFNAKYLRELARGGGARSRFFEDDSGRGHKYDQSSDTAPPRDSNPVDVVYLYVRLIPREWELADRDSPELWSFGIAADRVIVHAGPLRFDHGQSPIVIAAPSTTGHDTLPCSYLSTTYGLQQIMDWSMRAQVTNTNMALSGFLAVDPVRVNISDVKRPGPGKLLRVKPGAYGQNSPVRDAIESIPIAHVTGDYLAHTPLLMELMNRALGTTDVAMGDLSGLPERPGASGINAAEMGAGRRMERIARVIAEQTMYPLTFMFTYNTLQFMGQDVYVDIKGREEERLRQRYGADSLQVPVSVYDLSPNFNVVPYSESLTSQNGQAWTNILQTLLGVDGVAQDLMAQLGGIKGAFLHWAKAVGADDISTLMDATVQMRSDEDVANQVSAGNLVAMGAGMGAGMGADNVGMG